MSGCLKNHGCCVFHYRVLLYRHRGSLARFPALFFIQLLNICVFTWIFLLLTHRIKAGQLFCILAMFWAGIPWLEMMEWLKSREPISFLNLNLEKGKKKEAWAVRCSSQASEGNAEGDTGKPRGRCFLPPELDVSVFGTCSQMIYFYWISILLMSINWKKKIFKTKIITMVWSLT